MGYPRCSDSRLRCIEAHRWHGIYCWLSHTGEAIMIWQD
jgi:hypothetical protein